MLHETQSELAGQTVRLKPEVKHPQVPGFGGSEYTVEDWWDRIAGKSWGDCDGNHACLAYAMRAGLGGIPPDDEVLYGKVGGLGHLVHLSELDLATA